MARTVGSYQKRKFIETHLGRYIYLISPQLFNIICPPTQHKVGFAPDIDFILKICTMAENPSFENDRFKGYLKEYKEKGLVVARKKPITEKIRNNYNRVQARRAKNKRKSNGS